MSGCGVRLRLVASVKVWGETEAGWGESGRVRGETQAGAEADDKRDGERRR